MLVGGAVGRWACCPVGGAVGRWACCPAPPAHAAEQLFLSLRTLDRRPSGRPARHDFVNLPTLPPAATQTTMRRNTLNHFFGRMSLLFVEIEFPGEMVV